MIDLITKYEIKNKLNNDRLYEDLRQQLNVLEHNLIHLCDADNVSLTENLKRIILSGGKRLRPSLAYLCYRFNKGGKREIMPLMIMLELMHTASLIHDDVVDDADERRGVITIHKFQGRHFAVQSGDYLLAKAMNYLHIYRGTGINEALADISTQMCLGEFQQMKNLYKLNEQTIEKYFEQIKRKTAYLMATSCYTGAMAGGAGKEEAKSFKNYGECIGIAFQLKDDILDYKADKNFGKPLGQDLKRGIFTLPFLSAYENNPDSEMKELAQTQNKDEAEVKKLMDYVIESGGISYTEAMIGKYSDKAVSSLENIIECEEKTALIEMAKALMKRKL
jgi:heptaprenyl diphosphate synthase